MKNIITKTTAKKRIKRKTNPELAETIKEAIKHPNWNQIAKILSSSTKKHSAVNLFQIDKITETADTVVIPGKILSKGNLTKQVTICALSISQPALEKIKESKSKFKTILEEIKSNTKAEGLKILK